MIELDDDGYPTEESLSQVKNLKASEVENFLLNVLPEFDLPYLVVEKNTAHSKYNSSKTTTQICVHTQGWSGNEDLIAAMEANAFMSLRLAKWERGGHWTYEVTK